MINRLGNRKMMIFLLITLLIIGGFIWYRELNTNKEVPKRAKLVENILMESEGN